MPGKKKVKGKKIGKSKSAKSGTPEDGTPKPRSLPSGGLPDAISPQYKPIKPYLPPGETLVKLLSTHEVNEKELHGFKVTTKILEELTPEEIRELRVVFEIFDGNDDGYVNAIELRRSLKSLGFKINRDDAKKILYEGTVKKKGLADFNDFLEIIIDQQGESRDPQDEITKAFKLCDVDRRGKLTAAVMSQCALEAGVKFSEQEIQDMIQEADKDGDGMINLQEFTQIMLKTNLF